MRMSQRAILQQRKNADRDRDRRNDLKIKLIMENIPLIIVRTVLFYRFILKLQN